MNKLPLLLTSLLLAILALPLPAQFSSGTTQPAPTQPVPTDLPPNTKVQKDLIYVNIGPSPIPLNLKLDLYLPPPDSVKGPIPVLVRFAPHREAPARPASDLLTKGYALIYASYLQDDAPKNTAFNRFPEDLYAAKAAIRWTRGNAKELNLDTARIGVWGAGHGASLAALLATTSDQKDLAGNLGDFPTESTAVRAACLFGGTTDWRYAELYGDETVNLPDSPAYQLFGGNPKDNPEQARRASAIYYVRPTSPPLLMVTLSSDSNRAMHLIFAETLRRAGVASALYEEPPGTGAGLGGRAVDEARLDRTILEFFADTLAGKNAPAEMSVDDEVTKLTNAGLYKQARRIIEEQVDAAPKGGRDQWLKRVRAITDKQTTQGLVGFSEAKKRFAAEHPDAPRATWTSREVLTDPERIGETNLVASPSALEFDAAAAALKQVEALNKLLVEKDFPAADKQAALMKTLAADKQADPAILRDYLTRYADLRAHPDQSWPQGIKPVPYASASGKDLYGHWFTMRAGGIIQRFRYIPPGKFDMGSPRNEWSRLPDEPILEPTEIKQGFWLADAPVTQETWDGVLQISHEASRPPQNATHPATNLSYAHAVNFTGKLGIEARLPTAAEWEYACRAESKDTAPVTGRLSDSAWFWDEAKAPPGSSPEIRILSELESDRTAIPRSTHPVKEKLPNKWGLYDMQGNVWQWCAGTSSDKPRDFHLAKGGSWISLPQSCRPARNAWFPIEQQSWHIGLRILIPAQPQ